MSKNSVSLAPSHVRKLITELQPGKRIRSNVLEYFQAVGESYLSRVGDALVEVSRERSSTLLSLRHVLEAHDKIGMGHYNEELEQVGLKNNKRRKMKRWSQMTEEEKELETKRRYERAQAAIAQLGPEQEAKFGAAIEQNFMDNLPAASTMIGDDEEDDYDEDD